MPVGTRKTSGDRLSIAAADFNRWQEAADRVRRGKTFDPRALDLGGFRYATAKVRNDAGETLEAFDVVGLGEPLIAPVANEEEFLRQATFEAVLPVAGTHENKFGILLEPLVEKALGEVLLVGVVQTRLTGANVGFADITDGVPILAASAGGSAQVLWAEAGSAERWALVRLGGGGGSSTSAFSGVLVQSSASSPPTLTNGGGTTLTWAAELYDTDGYWSSGDPTKLVIPETAKYVVTASTFWTGTSQVALIVLVDGMENVPRLRQDARIETTFMVQHGVGMASPAVTLSAGVKLQLDAYHNRGSDYTIDTAVHRWAFGVHRVN